MRSGTKPTQNDSVFRLALDLAPTAIVVVDQEGRIALVNKESERLFGYAREQLVGQHVEQLVPERYRAGHPGHRNAFLAAPEARPMGRGRDLYALRSDGQEVPVEIGLNPIETESGRLIVTTVIDQTERRRAEARFRTVVESAPSGMLMIDTTGNIVLANHEAERTFGYESGELEGPARDPRLLGIADRRRAHARTRARGPAADRNGGQTRPPGGRADARGRPAAADKPDAL